MRQFLSPRFWLALAALAGLALVLTLVFRDGSSTADVGPSSAGPVTHRIDLVAPIAEVDTAAGFAVEDGVTLADMTLGLDPARTMLVTAGTRGEIDCPEFPQAGRCTVVADLLGDAVLWFAIVPGPPGATITLPAVAHLLDGGWVELSNGWQLRRASTVERSCADDTTSLSEFIRTFGDQATSSFNLESQRIVRVTCPAGGVSATTTTTVPGDSVPGETVPSGGEGDDTVPVTPTT